MEVNSNMALAAIVAGEHSICSSICNFRSLLDRRVPLHSKQGLLPSVTCPRFCRVCVRLCNGIYRDEYFVYTEVDWVGSRLSKGWRGGVEPKELNIQTQPIYVHTHNSSLFLKKCCALLTASPLLNRLALT